MYAHLYVCMYVCTYVRTETFRQHACRYTCRCVPVPVLFIVDVCVYIYTHTDAITFTYMRIHTPCKSLASRKPWALPVGLGLSDLGHLRFCLVLAAKGFRAGFLRDLKEDIGVQRFSMLTLALSENFQHD